MTTAEMISSTVAIAALLVAIIAVLFSAIQTKRATEALLLNQNVSRANSVMFFTSRYFDLGEPFQKPDKESTYQFWSLHATEFYFFHHGIVPEFMYSLWMIDLAKAYASPLGEQIRKSHSEYLDTYSLNYRAMTDFFNELYNLARAYEHTSSRNEKVAAMVSSWISKNRRTAFD